MKTKNKTCRSEFIERCRESVAAWRAENKPWVLLVRKPHGAPLDREERRKQLLGLRYTVGKGEPVGTAFLYTEGADGPMPIVYFGAAMRHPRDEWNDDVGLYTAIKAAKHDNMVALVHAFQRRKGCASHPCWDSVLASLVAPFPKRARVTLRYMLQNAVEAYVKSHAAPALT